MRKLHHHLLMVNLGFVDFLCTKTGRWLQTIYQVGGVSELVGWIESAAAAATAVAAAGQQRQHTALPLTRPDPEQGDNTSTAWDTAAPYTGPAYPNASKPIQSPVPAEPMMRTLFLCFRYPLRDLIQSKGHNTYTVWDTAAPYTGPAYPSASKPTQYPVPAQPIIRTIFPCFRFPFSFLVSRCPLG